MSENQKERRANKNQLKNCIVGNLKSETKERNLIGFNAITSNVSSLNNLERLK